MRRPALRADSLLRQRDFRSWYLARVTSITGSIAAAVALPILVYRESGSPALTAVVSGLEAAPYLLFGLIAGATADRWPRRRTMIGSDLISALVTVTVPLAWLLGLLTTTQVLVCAGLGATCYVWFDAATWGAMPRLVGRDRLAEANGMVWSTAIALGIGVPAVVGVVVSVVDPVLVLLLDAATFLVSAALVAAIRADLGPEPQESAERPRLRADIGEGLRYLWQNPVLRTLTAAGTTLSISGGGVAGLLVVHADLRLGIDPDDGRIGLLFASSALGAFLATLLLPRLRRRVGDGMLSFLAYLGYLPLLVGLGLSPGFVWALVAWAAWDAAYSLAISNGITVRQLVTPDELQGRVNTSGRMIAWGGAPIGALGGGLLAEHADITTTYLLLAVPVLLGASLIARSPVPRFDTRAVDEIHVS